MMRQQMCKSSVLSVFSFALATSLSATALAQDFLEVEAALQVDSPSAPEGRVIQAFTPKKPGNPQAASTKPKPAEKKSPGGEKKKPGDAKKDDKEKKGAGNKGTPDTVTRPTTPESPPDPAELENRPNAAGKVRLNFTGQPWPDVLEWLKVVSNLTLDWQELPGGYLNLVTHREYTVPEARSLINRHLLSRGYTIVINGEVMTVEKVATLNPAVVPRVTSIQLDERDSYEFVKVSFKLEGMLAEDAAEEFKPMLSANGKLTPLSSSNWLEAMDAAINLRDVRDAVLAQQTIPEDEHLVRPFYLKHVRAEDIVNPLRELLGMPPVTPRGGGGGGGGGFNPGQMQQFVQQMQQMVQQMQQAAQQNKGGGGGGGVRSRRQEKVHIVPVARDNSVLVSGPPDKIALIEDAILILDQPPAGQSSTLESIAETDVFRLAKLDPEEFEKMLREMGGLSPRTKIQVDKNRRTVVVTGPKTDRIIVELMIEKLDGSSRMFHVIALRKHDADYVSGSIRFMMGIEDEKEKNSRSGYNYYPWGGGGQQHKDSSDVFRIDADVEYNRLLLWCNKLELSQVSSLLIELGEIPAPGGNQNRRRVYEVDSIEDALNLIERLEKAWPSRGSNKLEITPPVIEPSRDGDAAPIGPQAPDKLEVKPADKTASDKQVHPAPPVAGRVVRKVPTTTQVELRGTELSGLFSVSQVEAGRDDATSQPESVVTPGEGDASTEGSTTDESAVTPMPLQGDDPAARFQKLLEELRNRRRDQLSGGATTQEPSGVAPIHIRLGPNGEIYLESNDTHALDMLEDIMDEYAPPKRDWKVFELKYPNTWAYGVEVILRDIFKEEIDAGKDKNGSGFGYDMFMGFYPQSSSKSGPRRMSRRKPLNIISDRDTHTILVQGANREQLQMIEELIAIYDKPESTEAHTIRKTQVFKIRYSTAKNIGDAVKDVYRDLLSENDKALQQEQGRGDKDTRPPASSNYTYIYGGGEGEGQEKEQPIRFKGLLSIGVDPVSNILIVSASEGLLNNVGQIIEALDEAARPNSAYQVMQVDSRVNTRLLQERLSKMFGPRPPQQNQQQKNQQQQQPGQNPNQPNAGTVVE